MEEIVEDTCPIISLPNEIVSLILKNNNCCEILNFGLTCKRFYDMVNYDQSLWKKIFKSTLPVDLAVSVEKECNADWFTEIKRYYMVKKLIYSELIAMSPKFYWRATDISLEDVRNFFAIALSHRLSYYYTVSTLQDIVKKGNINLEQMINEKPFTLTEMHFAKVALRHLIHTFLAVKWVKLHIKNELTPEIVINFFIQWIDTDNTYPDEDVKKKIDEVVSKVETLLEKNHPSKFTSDTILDRCAKGLIKESHIVAAITQVIYYQRHMAVTTTANVDTLNIIKVLENKCGSGIAVGAIYYAVAKRFSVNCDLIAFPNHLFLEWRDCSDYRNPRFYTIDLNTGEAQPKRRCPFSQGGPMSNYKYYPDSLLQYIYSAFHMTMGAIKNWQTQNALHLLDFLGTDDNVFNPYRNFLPYLLDLTHLPAMNTPLNFKNISQSHMQIITSLSNLNAASHNVSRSVTVKNHDCSVRYAVGMICYHKKYDYVCIIRGWDLICAEEWLRRMEIDSLEYGGKQPFYHVIVADQSERYVAQENLIEVRRPTRLYHLEDLVAREFTHFDGFAYMLNDDKKKEYPNEGPIVDAYRNHCELKPGSA